MKPLLYTLLSLLILTACKKDNAEIELTGGKWVHTDSFSSPGGPGSWYSAQETPRLTVSFSKSGAVSGTAFPEYKTYTVKDSVTLVFYKADQTLQNYRYKIEGDKLTMSPAGPILCYEGCATRFQKD